MYRNFNLIIALEKRTLSIPVQINGISEKRSSLHTSYKGRQIRQICVLPKKGVSTVSTLDDVDCLVDRSQTDSMFCPDKGKDGVIIDKSVLKTIFPSSRDIKVMCSLSLDRISPFMFDGSHYTLVLGDPVTKKKTKTVDPEQHKLYNIVFHGMKALQTCFIARFVSFNREKFCAIYPTKYGLMMSILIHSNYLHPSRDDQLLDETKVAELLKTKKAEKMDAKDPIAVLVFSKIHSQLKVEKLDPESYTDRYEEKLKKLIAKSVREASKVTCKVDSDSESEEKSAPETGDIVDALMG